MPDTADPLDVNIIGGSQKNTIHKKKKKYIIHQKITDLNSTTVKHDVHIWLITYSDSSLHALWSLTTRWC